MTDDMAQLLQKRDLVKIEIDVLTEKNDDIETESLQFQRNRADNQLALVNSEIRLLELKQAEAERRHQASLMHRPQLGFISWIAPLLGPLPEVKKLKWSNYEASKFKSQRALAIAMVIVVTTITLTLAWAVPWMRYSLLSFCFGLVPHSTILSANLPMLLVLGFLFYHFVYRKEDPAQFLGEHAIKEEQWFRAGAENWTIQQRITSCLLFGLCHVVNLVVPLSTLIALSAGGAVLMWAYLREYRRSGDSRAATIATARLHQTYNYYALLVLAVVVLVYTAWIIVAICIAFTS